MLGSVFDRFVQYNAVFHYREDGGRATTGKPAWWTKDIIIITDESLNEITKELPIEESKNTNDSKIVITSVSEGKAAFENWLTMLTS